MPARTLIRFVDDNITYDEVRADECGIVTLTGWSNRPSEEIPEPILILNGARRTPQNFWRVHRPDIMANVLAGFRFDWIVDRYPAPAPPPRAPSLRERLFASARPAARDPELAIAIGDHFFACTPPGCYRKPDCNELLTIDRVLKRDEIYGSGPPYLEVPTEVMRLLPLITGPRILDFGCGSGALVKALQQRGHDALGIEIDRPEITNNLLPDVANHITLYRGGTLPFADGAFDTAVAFEVIEHVIDYEQALSELKRVAQRLFLSVPDISTVATLSRLDVVPWHLLEATHFNFFNEKSLKELLRRYFASVQIGRMSERTLEGTCYHLSLLAVCG